MNLSYFYKPTKVRQDPNEVFFWSDLHLGHDPSWDEPLWAKRGFGSMEGHDQTLIQNWKNKINDRCVVFLLGDIMFGKDGETRIKRLLNELPFRDLVLLAGNHHVGYKQLLSEFRGDIMACDSFNGLPRLDWQGWEERKCVYFAPNYLEIYVGRTPVVLSHYPVKCHNGYAHGSFMVHGHVHGSLASSAPDADCGKILDVGVENFKEPVSFTELTRIMARKTVVTESHHKRDGNTPFC